MTPQALGQAFYPRDVLTFSRRPSKVSIIILPLQMGDMTLEARGRSPLSPPDSGAGILSVVPSCCFPGDQEMDTSVLPKMSLGHGMDWNGQESRCSACQSGEYLGP